MNLTDLFCPWNWDLSSRSAFRQTIGVSKWATSSVKTTFWPIRGGGVQVQQPPGPACFQWDVQPQWLEILFLFDLEFYLFFLPSWQIGPGWGLLVLFFKGDDNPHMAQSQEINVMFAVTLEMKSGLQTEKY